MNLYLEEPLMDFCICAYYPHLSTPTKRQRNMCKEAGDSVNPLKMLLVIITVCYFGLQASTKLPEYLRKAYRARRWAIVLENKVIGYFVSCLNFHKKKSKAKLSQKTWSLETNKIESSDVPQVIPVVVKQNETWPFPAVQTVKKARMKISWLLITTMLEYYLDRKNQHALLFGFLMISTLGVIWNFYIAFKSPY